MIAAITSEKDGVMTVTPHDKQQRFPEFTKIEIDDRGYATGWVLTGKLKDTQRYDLGQPGKGAEVIQQNNKQVVFKLK